MPHTHTHTPTTFGHGPEGGVNRLTGGWAISSVESNYQYVLKGFHGFVEGGGWMLRGHSREWNLFPLAEGKVSLL